MDNIIDLIATDAKPNEISDQIKDLLYAKSADKIEGIKPDVAAKIFIEPETEVETEVEPQQEQ